VLKPKVIELYSNETSLAPINYAFEEAGDQIYIKYHLQKNKKGDAVSLKNQ